MKEPNPAHPEGLSSPSIQEGPSHAPPSLPEGWYVFLFKMHRSKLNTSLHRLAQWEGQSRKYYYVERATGHSQWDIPTQPALSVPTPDPTPQPITHPFSQPSEKASEDETAEGYEGADRSLLGVRKALAPILLRRQMLRCSLK